MTIIRNFANTAAFLDSGGRYPSSNLSGTISTTQLAVDTSNATNITTGTLASARLSGSYGNITGVGALSSITFSDSTVQNSAANTYAVGVGQTWSLPSRSGGTTYYNTTAKPIQCFITCNQTLTPTITVNGTNIISGLGSTATYVTYAFIVPPGGSYSASTVNSWAELR